MSQIDDGGPAFPVPDVHHPSGQIQFGSSGMSLRDWFAAQALEKASRGARFTAEEIARRAYYIADAMLAARLTERK